MAGSSDDEETGRFVDEESQNSHDASTKGSKLSRRAENALPDKQVRRKKWQRQGSDDGDGELEEKEASLPRKGSKNDSAEDEAASGSPDHNSQIRKKSGSRVTSRTTVTDNKLKSPSKFTKDTATSEEDEEKLQRQRGSSSTSSSKYRKKVSLSTDDDEAHAVSDQRASTKHADLGKGKKEPVSKQDSSDKRAAFASRGKANTIATSTVVHSKKSVTLKERSGSIEATTKSRSESEGSDSSPRRVSHGASPRKVSFGVRKASSDRPPWSPSTKVDHKPVHNQTLINRRASAGNELDDSKKHAAQIRARWENKSFDDGESHGSGYVRPKAFGGSTAASALKARFENKGDASKKRASVDVEDGKTVLSASGMRARFEQNAEEPASVKRNFVISKGRPGGGKKFMPAVSNKCQACEKTVYPVEKLEADGHVFHKFCFRCTTCNRTLGVGNYAALEGKVYCKPHLKQLFKLKGNYDEGFGRQTHKTLWLQKDGAVGGALAPAGDDDNTGDEGERDPSHENGHALKVVDSQDDGHSGSDNDE